MKATMRHATNRGSMPERRSDHAVSATPPAPAAANSRVATKPDPPPVTEAAAARRRSRLGEQKRSHHGCGEVQRGHRGQGITSEHTVERAPAVSPEELAVLDHH